MAAQLRHFIKKYPIIPNALVYGTMVVGAEFSQQTLNKRYFVCFERIFVIILKSFSYKRGWLFNLVFQITLKLAKHFFVCTWRSRLIPTSAAKVVSSTVCTFYKWSTLLWKISICFKQYIYKNHDLSKILTSFLEWRKICIYYIGV